MGFAGPLLLEQKDKEYLKKLPNQRYSCKLNGLEFTIGMIADFEHIINFTGEEVDRELAGFNALRRREVNLPDTWNNPPISSSQESQDSQESQKSQESQ